VLFRSLTEMAVFFEKAQQKALRTTDMIRGIDLVEMAIMKMVTLVSELDDASPPRSLRPLRRDLGIHIASLIRGVTRLKTGLGLMPVNDLNRSSESEDDTTVKRGEGHNAPTFAGMDFGKLGSDGEVLEGS